MSQNTRENEQSSNFFTGAAGDVVLLLIVIVPLVLLASLAVAVGVFGFWGDGRSAGPTVAVAIGLSAAAPAHHALGGSLGPLVDDARRVLPHHPLLRPQEEVLIQPFWLRQDPGGGGGPWRTHLHQVHVAAEAAGFGVHQVLQVLALVGVWSCMES